jgi:nitrate/nitrite transport system ATP-binding protein
MKAYLDFSHVSKHYPQAGGVYTVLEDFKLTIAQGEFVAIIGHSGCGKSTALMMAAGLTSPSTGGVILENRLVDEPGTDRGVVFQSPSLLPWLSALENVLLGVRQVYPRASRQQQRDTACYYLQQVGLGHALHQRATQLSSGMQQRVSLARAFALRPKLLLLDEPFGMLDSLTRAELQTLLLEVWQSERITALMVTHDVDEALFLADRVVMMTHGPRAKVGDILSVPFSRPRHKEDVVGHPAYPALRAQLIGFLEETDRVAENGACQAFGEQGAQHAARCSTEQGVQHTAVPRVR